MKIFDSMKRHMNLLSALLFAVILFSGCSMSRISVSDVSLQRVSPKGLRTLSVQAGAMFDNPTRQVSVYDIEGTVHYRGKVLGTVVAEPFDIAPKCTARASVNAEISLSPEISLKEVLKLAAGPAAMKECTVDIHMKVKRKGLAPMALNRKGVPLEELFDIVR